MQHPTIDKKMQRNDIISVTATSTNENMHWDCGAHEVPHDMDDDTAILVGRGLVQADGHSPFKVIVTISRECDHEHRIIYTGY